MTALSRYNRRHVPIPDVPRCLRCRLQKRRAQVREAQRTYQRRKDAATAHERRRADELLQLLSSLSTDVEALLQAALMAGNMHRDDKVSKTVQRLWSTYDTVVNSDCVKPELRFHQLKNNRRLATHTTSPNLQEDVSSVPQVEPETAVRLRKSPDSFDASAISFDLVRFEETTVMSSFQRTAATDRYMAGKSMFDLVTERQAAMKESDRRKSQSSQSRD
jgi:hypothetical protein